MNGLKVYLKSGTTRVYVYSQALLGCFLIGNAFREYEHVQGHLLQILTSVLAGLLLMAGFTVPKRWRRNLRYVPGILLALGGLSLLWLTKVSGSLAYSRFNIALIVVSYCLLGVGLMQPLIDPRHYAFFSARGIRCRLYTFRKIFIPWSDIKAIAFFDQGFEVALKNGKSFKMRPYNGESQNLRMYIDQMLQSGRQHLTKEQDAEESHHPMVTHQSVAEA